MAILTIASILTYKSNVDLQVYKKSACTFIHEQDYKMLIKQVSLYTDAIRLWVQICSVCDRVVNSGMYVKHVYEQPSF